MARILLVEDDRAIADNWRILLADEAGHNVSVAHSAEDALLLLESQSCDLIISDIRLPQMDGFEFKKELNKRKVTTPLIFLTAYAVPSTALLSRQVGAISFLTKPIPYKDLLNAVEKALLYSRVVRFKPERISPVAKLRVLCDLLGFDYLLSEDYVVGRSDSADIRLLHKAASRQTAIFSKKYKEDEDGEFLHYLLVDYSRNGITINGKPVKGYKILEHGDFIEFPGCRMDYLLLDRPDANPNTTTPSNE